jgi:YidC/Oxa1 family membrane protein insertase
MQHNRMPRPEDHNRLVIFFVIAAVVMSLSYLFITKPRMEQMRAEQTAVAAEKTPTIVQSESGIVELKAVDDALTSEGARLKLDNGDIAGSFAQKGLRFDDVELQRYFTTLEKTDKVRLLAPSETKIAYFVEVGLMPADKNVTAPTNDTVWKIVSGKQLDPETSVVLEWNNGQGVLFRRTVSIDEQYVITVVQSVENQSDHPITFYPYGLISQSHHIPAKGEKVSFEERDAGIQHIGPVAFVNDELEEESYSDVQDEEMFSYPDAKGWVGITGKYWLVGLLPDKETIFDARFAHRKGEAGQDIYQVDLRAKPVKIEPNATESVTTRVFAGVKKLSVLNNYAETLEIRKLDLAIDFGVLYILTKPLYQVLSFLGDFYKKTFNFHVSFGLALLTLTVLVRLVLFPLQTKAYRAMNKMKDLGPKLHALKEKYPDDKQKFQQEVFQMYKTEKVNPASGCLPILIQIPIFFALYKVIYITLDMRHAPFWGWIHDLSEPDLTNVWNLFGLLPFNTPEFLVIGAWPLLYGLTMWAQQKLNPQPEDEMQKQIFAMMPWIFTFVFAKFPAGLVIYYTWSNLLGVIQQYSLRKMHPTPKKPDAK